jgi:hypothetical protein
MQVYFSDLMAHVPENLFNEVGAELKVDRYNHKLTGKSLFQILLYNLCEEDRISLRVIEDSFNNHQFKLYHNGKPLKASKSGISDRLKTINYKYYESIFMTLQNIFAKQIPGHDKQRVKRFDSTLVTLSSKLLKDGFKVPIGDKHQIKFSIGFDGLPRTVRIGTARSDMSENIALRNAIKEASLSKDDIAVFDRGISARKTFKDFNKSGIRFVTRLSANANYRVIEQRSLEKINIENATNCELEITSDSIVQLRSRDVHWVKENFRLIKAESKTTHKVFLFLSNVMDMSAIEITEIYKARWDIEVFFKFIKQHLNTKHFLSRSINGIKVVFYMILIAALLILTFKIANKIESFKFAKKQFVEQLRRALTYDIILLYKNNPGRFRQSFEF